MVYYPHRDVCKTGLAQNHIFSSKLAVKSNLLADLHGQWTVWATTSYPGALINLSWEPANISLRQSLCDVLRQLEGSFSSVVLCHWKSAQSSDQGRHRAEQPLQSSWEAGLGVRGMALWKGTALPVWKSLFFLCPVSRQAEMAPREQFHQCTWFFINLSTANLRWEKEVVGGWGVQSHTVAAVCSSPRAPAKHS